MPRRNDFHRWQELTYEPAGQNPGEASIPEEISAFVELENSLKDSFLEIIAKLKQIESNIIRKSRLSNNPRTQQPYSPFEIKYV
jgi:hypothetical protein